MSHEIDTTNGQSSFVAARDDAWHQLGITLDHSFTAEEAMEHGLLGGWNVRKVLVTAEAAPGLRITIPGMNAVVRDNPVESGQVDVLSKYNVSDTFQIIQNEEHAGLLNAIVDESGANFETAGALYGGRQVFISMKLPGHISIGGVDPVNNYLTAINAHDGSSSFTLMITPVRVVCANTLNAAFANHSHLLRIRHTSGAQRLMVQQAREALEVTFKYLDAFQEEAERLINATMTQVQFEEIIAKEFGAARDAHPGTITRTENKLDQLSQLFSEAYTQDGIRNTAWAGFNALTEWSDHFSPARGEDHDTARALRAVLDPSFKNQALRMMMATTV